MTVFKWILLRLQPSEEVIQVYETNDDIDREMTPCPNCDYPALKRVVGYDPQEIYFSCGSVILLSEDKKIDKFIGGEECLIMGDKLIDITRGIEQ